MVIQLHADETDLLIEFGAVISGNHIIQTHRNMQYTLLQSRKLSFQRQKDNKTKCLQIEGIYFNRRQMSTLL